MLKLIKDKSTQVKVTGRRTRRLREESSGKRDAGRNAPSYFSPCCFVQGQVSFPVRCGGRNAASFKGKLAFSILSNEIQIDQGSVEDSEWDRGVLCVTGAPLVRGWERSHTSRTLPHSEFGHCYSTVVDVGIFY